MKRGLLWLMVLLWACWPSNAQAEIEARFEVDNPSPLVGEPVHLTLIAQAGRDIVITRWPELQDQHWDILTVQAAEELVTRENDDGTITYQQTYAVLLWYPGEYGTPEATIGYQRIGQEETHEISVAPAFFSVPSVLDAQDLTLRPLKPQIWLPYVSPLLVLAGAAAVVVGGAVAYRLSRARRALLPQPTPVEDAQRYSPAQAALLELRRIQGQNLPVTTQFAAVADCLRVYLQRQFNVSAQDFTTEELIETLLYTRVIPDDIRLELERLLRQADLVKFARYEPGEQNARRYLNAAGRWVQAVDKSVGTLQESDSP